MKILRLLLRLQTNTHYHIWNHYALNSCPLTLTVKPPPRHFIQPNSVCFPSELNPPPTPLTLRLLLTISVFNSQSFFTSTIVSFVEFLFWRYFNVAYSVYYYFLLFFTIYFQLDISCSSLVLRTLALPQCLLQYLLFVHIFYFFRTFVFQLIVSLFFCFFLTNVDIVNTVCFLSLCSVQYLLFVHFFFISFFFQLVSFLISC